MASEAQPCPPADAALPAGWRADVDTNGNTFYLNDLTKETQWERPGVTSQVLLYWAIVVMTSRACCAERGLHRCPPVAYHTLTCSRGRLQPPPCTMCTTLWLRVHTSIKLLYKV